MIVSLHIAGNPNKKIAAAVGITPERVSQVLSDPQAIAVIQRVKNSMRLKMEEDIEDKLVVLASESVDRIAETITHEFLPGSDEHEHQDRVAIKVLQGTGFLKKESPEGGGKTREVPSTRLLERLASALEKANTAVELQQEAVDAPYEVLSEETDAQV